MKFWVYLVPQCGSKTKSVGIFTGGARFSIRYLAQARNKGSHEFKKRKRPLHSRENARKMRLALIKRHEKDIPV